ncbi:MAG: PAS domain-containing protein [Candidatus Omnitrophica bacterium]|nr:PAS domain-containing protein [Candidatus Omnitrophota bacterium]
MAGKENKTKKPVPARENLTPDIMFRRFAEAAGQGLGMANMQGRVVYVNPALCRMFGEESPGDCYKKHLRDYYSKESYENFVTSVREKVLEKGHWTGEAVLLSAEGRKTPVIENIFIIKDAEGNPEYYANVITDITELKQKEQEIQNLAKFLSEDPSPVLRVDSQGRILYANESSEGLLKSWKTATGKTVPDEWIEIIKDALRTGENSLEESRSNSRFFSVHVAPITDSDYVNLYAHDITRRKLIENELKDSERFLQSVFDGIQDGISILDKDLNVVKTNLWIERMHEYAIPIVGKKCYEVYQQRSDVCPWCPSVKTFQTGQMESAVVPYPSEENPEGWMLLSSYPFRNAQGEMVGIIEHIKDITDLKMAEFELEAYRQHLEELVEERTRELGEANKELEAFSYSVSHDLRAPLRSMDGFSRILLEDYSEKLDQKGADHLRRIRSSCQHMGRLIDDILTLSKVTRQDLNRRTVNLSDIAADLVEDLKTRYSGKNIDFLIAPGLKVRADQRLMRIVMENLLENACKFSERKKQARVEVGSVDIGGEKAVFVRDNGVGFNMAYADRIFGPFQRVHSQKDFPGTGIGLATVKRIISRHGGRVWADSRPSRGATFYFTISDKSATCAEGSLDHTS